CLQYSSAPFTF
nr:immunoglobulin light chain junction region [Macaca mulatta]